MKSDTEDEDILEEKGAVPLRVRILSAWDWVGAPADKFPAAIDPGMILNMVNVKSRHLADLEVESMKKFILDYMRYSQSSSRWSVTKMAENKKILLN